MSESPEAILRSLRWHNEVEGKVRACYPAAKLDFHWGPTWNFVLVTMPSGSWARVPLEAFYREGDK